MKGWRSFLINNDSGSGNAGMNLKNSTVHRQLQWLEHTTFKHCSCTLKYDYLIFICFRRQASPVCIQNSVRFQHYHVKLHMQTRFIICPIFSTLWEAFFTPSRVVRSIDPVQSWEPLTTFRPWLSKLENSLTDCWNTKSDLQNQTKLWTCISCQCFLQDKEIQTHLCET